MVVCLDLVQLVKDVEFFTIVCLNYLGTEVCQARGPEDKSFGFFVAQPAVFTFTRQYLPLTGAWNLISMVQVAHEDQFLINVEKFVIGCPILNYPLRIVYLLDLNRLAKERLLECLERRLMQNGLQA